MMEFLTVLIAANSVILTLILFVLNDLRSRVMRLEKMAMERGGD